MDEKKVADDVWTMPIISQRDKSERVDYPTQKPVQLLHRIILASSNPGSLIADFFSGSGTSMAAAEALGRKWIGCDQGEVAIAKSRKRLAEGDGDPFGFWRLAPHDQLPSERA